MALLAAAPLLAGWACGPVLPEEDPLLLLDPAAIQRLRAEHGAILEVLEDWQDDEVVFITPQSRYHAHLAQGALTIKRSRALLGTTWDLDGQDGTPCGEADDCTSFHLQVERKRFLRKPQRLELRFDGRMQHSDDEQPKMIGLDCPACGDVPYDPVVLAQAFDAFITAVFADLEAYEDDFNAERERILSARIPCPESARPAYDAHACWCLDDQGRRHGPYLAGSSHLPGVVSEPTERGSYRQDLKHGSWTFYDAEGAETCQETWDAGQLIQASDADGPQERPCGEPEDPPAEPKSEVP